MQRIYSLLKENGYREVKNLHENKLVMNTLAGLGFRVSNGKIIHSGGAPFMPGEVQRVYASKIGLRPESRKGRELSTKLTESAGQVSAEKKLDVSIATAIVKYPIAGFRTFKIITTHTNPKRN